MFSIVDKILGVKKRKDIINIDKSLFNNTLVNEYFMHYGLPTINVSIIQVDPNDDTMHISYMDEKGGYGDLYFSLNSNNYKNDNKNIELIGDITYKIITNIEIKSHAIKRLNDFMPYAMNKYSYKHEALAGIIFNMHYNITNPVILFWLANNR